MNDPLYTFFLSYLFPFCLIPQTFFLSLSFSNSLFPRSLLSFLSTSSFFPSFFKSHLLLFFLFVFFSQLIVLLYFIISFIKFYLLIFVFFSFYRYSKSNSISVNKIYITSYVFDCVSEDYSMFTISKSNVSKYLLHTSHQSLFISFIFKPLVICIVNQLACYPYNSHLFSNIF